MIVREGTVTRGLTNSSGNAEALHKACFAVAAHSFPSAAVAALPNGVQAIFRLIAGAIFEDEERSSLLVFATDAHTQSAKEAEP